MRIAAWTFCAILAAGALLSAGTPEARADAPVRSVATQSRPATLADRTTPPQPSTPAEERDYARREAESPAAVRNYGGGFIITVLVIVALVFLIIYLARLP